MRSTAIRFSQMFPKQLLHLCILATIALSCRSARFASASTGELSSLLVNGDDEVALRRVTEEILVGRKRIQLADISDNRNVARSLLLRATYGNRDYQLGVSTVSDYAICLLQIRHSVSTLSVLRQVAPALAKNCSQTEGSCDVCNSQSFPVDARVRDVLQQYWRSSVETK
jgi:hypothetical protein